MGEAKQKREAQDAESAEPAWIRDLAAANMFLAIAPERVEEMLHKIFEGLKVYCDFCGKKCALWPPRDLAVHSTSAHADEMTLQQLAGLVSLTNPVYGPAHMQYIAVHMQSRVEIRRRAHALGLMHEAVIEPEQSQIIVPEGIQ